MSKAKELIEEYIQDNKPPLSELTIDKDGFSSDALFLLTKVTKIARHIETLRKTINQSKKLLGKNFKPLSGDYSKQTKAIARDLAKIDDIISGGNKLSKLSSGVAADLENIAADLQSY